MNALINKVFFSKYPSLPSLCKCKIREFLSLWQRERKRDFAPSQNAFLAGKHGCPLDQERSRHKLCLFTA
jgi:hypothetical protein